MRLKLAPYVFVFLALFGLMEQAFAKRVALVIGNGAYEDAGQLANPVNDATDIAAQLKAVGFDVVLDGYDLGKRELEQLIGTFADELAGADVGLFFYAGHGIQVDGRNYLIPVDARLDVPAKLRLEAMPMDDILNVMEQQTTTSLVFLDACRNNPFTRSLSRAVTTRAVSVDEGLAQFGTGRGSFIAFSTSPGNVAQDGRGRNSPFAAALIKHINTPGQSISDMMIEVRRDVIAETKDQQRPWEQGSLTERFEFVKAGAIPVVALSNSVPDKDSIKLFLEAYYLSPPEPISETIEGIYADQVSSYGKNYSRDEILKVKLAWFARWKTWQNALIADSLKITLNDENQADVAFDMTYDYAPKAGGKNVSGQASVELQLNWIENEWWIVRENGRVR